MPSRKIVVNYVTSNEHKIEENRVFSEIVCLPDGRMVGDVFEFRVRRVPVKERLETDLAEMVRAEVAEAYSAIRVPCIVEHAGLIFRDYEAQSYPGGLTKPMWNTLRDRFVEETKAAGRAAIARAVVAYCDGMGIRTFVGETRGQLLAEPRGDRQFYWDTVFVPDEAQGNAAGKTYSEIVADASLGLPFKIKNLSQSTRAMLEFLKHRVAVGPSKLWGGDA